MSTDYFTVEVSKKTASIANRIILTGAAIGVILLAISVFLFVSGSTDAAIIVGIVGLGVMIVGILAYMVTALIGSIESKEAREIAKRVAIILPTTFILFFALLFALGGI